MVDVQKLMNMAGGGALLVEINDCLHKVMKDCLDTEKKGELTIKFTIEPVKGRDSHQFKITPNVVTKNPKYDSGVLIVHAVTDENNQLVDFEREDPRQMSLIMSAQGEFNNAR